MNEAFLKDKLRHAIEEALRGSLVLRHEDMFKHGIPDTSVTWNGSTSWLEAKYGNPHFKRKGVQDLLCQRLAKQGKCWFVIYHEKERIRRTLIVHPQDIDHWDDTPDERVASGFNHAFVVAFIRSQHDHNKS